MQPRDTLIAGFGLAVIAAAWALGRSRAVEVVPVRKRRRLRETSIGAPPSLARVERPRPRVRVARKAPRT